MSHTGMGKGHVRRLALFGVLLAASLGGASRSHAAGTGALERLAWLGGCWRAEGGESGSGEQWLPLAGGTMLGVARTVRQGATVSFEYMQIRQQDDGAVVFAAQPSGRPPTLFTLQPGGPLEAVFENPEIEFPRRVIYRLGDAGRLQARIEGQRAGAPAGIDFPLRRVACDGSGAQPEAFQGLPWGALEEQMKLRFGPALKSAECLPAGRAQGLRGGEACNHPTLQPYEVGGIPFRLNLHVDEGARQLQRVVLSWSGEGLQAAATDNGWSEKHRLLRLLLTQRYGSPESTQVHSEADNYLATARWRRGETMIELNSTFQPRKAGTPARERVEIVYQPITSGDAGKL